MVGMTFSSLQDINVEYYKNYARYLGFGIGKISSKIRDDEKKKKNTLLYHVAVHGVIWAIQRIFWSQILSREHNVSLEWMLVSLDGTITIWRVVIKNNHELSQPSQDILDATRIWILVWKWC